MAGKIIYEVGKGVISLLGRSTKNLKVDKKLRKEFLKTKEVFKDNQFKLYKRSAIGTFI